VIKRKPLELPLNVAHAFIADMRAFHTEGNAIKRDKIAARQLRALRQYYAGKLRVSDIKEMFQRMREH
jgi:hypothetical protein